MAEEQVEENVGEEAAGSEAQEGKASGGGKKKLFLGGGILGIVAAGAMAAMMAVPTKEVTRTYQGPYTLALFDGQFNCNISEKGRTRFLQMKPQVVYFAYDPLYMSNRFGDELYHAQVQNTVFNIASRKSLDEIYGEVNTTTFMSELRDALDPVLFPVHLGSTANPWDIDEISGLRPGMSSDSNTFRGRFEDHVLHVSAENEMWIDDGPKTTFERGEFDIRLITSDGEVVFVDTSTMKEEFVGDIQIGVMGGIMRILPVDLLVQ